MRSAYSRSQRGSRRRPSWQGVFLDTEVRCLSALQQPDEAERCTGVLELPACLGHDQCSGSSRDPGSGAQLVPASISSGRSRSATGAGAKSGTRQRKSSHRALDFPHRWRYAASAIKLNDDDNSDRSGTQKAGPTAPLESPVGGLGQFTEQALLVLASLAAGPKHGYAIARDVRALTGIAIGPGTLYVVIARLERQGRVRRLPAEGRRQPYALTRAGAEALRAESAHLRSFAETLVRRAALA